MGDVRRRLPVGAEVRKDGGVHFRVWAPRRRTIEVVPEGGRAPLRLDPERDGYFSGLVPHAAPGLRYRYRLDGGQPLPDPASRFQPDGPHGPSQVVDPGQFAWTDHDWRGVEPRGQVLYEMHIGTFTAEGTWEAAVRELPALAELGVTVLEVMPVAEFAGRFGWGYDGVDLFAPTRLYGEPDAFRAFVDRAHALGLGVILDVVYNHLGPDGNYLKQYADEYFTDRYETDWGEPINFDGESSGPVREFFVANAGYWVDEFHVDGLRLDATQSIFDQSPVHVLAEIGRRVREAARGRATFIVAENEPQQTRLVRPLEEDGYGLDALWNDDLHHTILVALTGRTEAYYTDYGGTAQELVSAMKHGYLFQGQWYAWQKQRRGTPTFGLKPWAFVSFIENHDQIANTDTGSRVHQRTSPGRWRALSAVVLLGPETPMLFQGEEFASSRPFLYFADHHEELARMVREGRQKFLEQFPSIAQPDVLARLPAPDDPATFERCKLDHGERSRHREAWALHRDLLRLRRDDPVFRGQGAGGFDGAVLSPQACVLRWFGGAEGDRLLVLNLGQDLELARAPEPLLAPPPDRAWQTTWYSEHPDYGGHGITPVTVDGAWRLPAECAVAFAPAERRRAAREPARVWTTWRSRPIRSGTTGEGEPR
jgi:maltooligosyltrehalose trehalohydrolase